MRFGRVWRSGLPRSLRYARRSSIWLSGSPMSRITSARKWWAPATSLGLTLVVGLLAFVATIGLTDPAYSASGYTYDVSIHLYDGVPHTVQAPTGEAASVVSPDGFLRLQESSTSGTGPPSVFLLKSVAANTGAQSVVSGTRLNLRLASEQQIGETGTPIIGAGTDRALLPQTTGRLTRQYGGIADDWAKMTSSSYTARNGFTIETHWYENLSNGLRVEPKTKFWWQSTGAG